MVAYFFRCPGTLAILQLMESNVIPLGVESGLKLSVPEPIEILPDGDASPAVIIDRMEVDPVPVPSSAQRPNFIPENSPSHALEIAKYNGAINTEFGLPERCMRHYLIKEAATGRLVSLVEALSPKTKKLAFVVEGELFHALAPEGTPLFFFFTVVPDNFFPVVGPLVSFQPQAHTGGAFKSDNALYISSDPDPLYMPVFQDSLVVAAVLVAMKKSDNPSLDAVVAATGKTVHQLANTIGIWQFLEDVPVVKASPLFLSQLNTAAASHPPPAPLFVQSRLALGPEIPKSLPPRKRKIPPTLGAAVSAKPALDVAPPASKRQKRAAAPISIADDDDDVMIVEQGKLKQGVLDFTSRKAEEKPQPQPKPKPLPSSKLADVSSILKHRIEEHHFGKCLMIWQFFRIHRTAPLLVHDALLLNCQKQSDFSWLAIHCSFFSFP